MNISVSGQINDPVQSRLADYAAGLSFEALPGEAVNAAKLRLVDTLGVLIGGLDGEPCRIARAVAGQMKATGRGATLVGTAVTTTPEMAALANGTAARYLDMNDTYNWPNSAHGHPSDCIAPVLAAAEVAGASGRDLIVGTVLGYEIFLRTSDMFRNHRIYDTANLTCLSAAVGAGKMLGLDRFGLAQAIAMAIVPNQILKQVRLGKKSMYKAVASGHGGKDGVFAALLAKAGMDGPDMPFEGQAGWCGQIANGPFEPVPFGGEGEPFKVLASAIKLRPANAGSIAAILAAEEIGVLEDVDAVDHIEVEVSFYTKRAVGSGEVPWKPDTREIADHSIPYLVATTLVDGTVGVGSFSHDCLHNPKTRSLIDRLAVSENPDFTKAYDSLPVRELSRVTITLKDGTRLIGESDGGGDSLSAPKTPEQISRKFRELAAPVLGETKVEAALDALWHLDKQRNIDGILRLLSAG